MSDYCFEEQIKKSDFYEFFATLPPGGGFEFGSRPCFCDVSLRSHPTAMCPRSDQCQS